MVDFLLSSQPLNWVLCEFLAEPHAVCSRCHLSGLCYWCAGSTSLPTWTSKKTLLLPFLLLLFNLWSILPMLLGFRLCFWGNTCSGRCLLLSVGHEHQRGQSGYESRCFFLFGEAASPCKDPRVPVSCQLGWKPKSWRLSQPKDMPFIHGLHFYPSSFVPHFPLQLNLGKVWRSKLFLLTLKKTSLWSISGGRNQRRERLKNTLVVTDKLVWCSKNSKGG